MSDPITLLSSMATRVGWLGHACLQVETGGSHLLIDPFLTDHTARPGLLREAACHGRECENQGKTHVRSLVTAGATGHNTARAVEARFPGEANCLWLLGAALLEQNKIAESIEVLETVLDDIEARIDQFAAQERQRRLVIEHEVVVRSTGRQRAFVMNHGQTERALL